MASMNIENGETIDQLESLTNLSDNDMLLVTKDGVTGNVTVAELKKAFCGDGETERLDNSYLSAKEVSNQLDKMRQLISQNTQLPVDELNNRIDRFEETINTKITNINREIEYIKNYLKI